MKKVSPPPAPSFSFSHLLNNWLTFDGRLNRRPFLIRYGLYWLCGQLLAMLFLSRLTEVDRELLVDPNFNPATYAEMPTAIVQAQGAISILFLLLLPTIVRRLKDLNLHPFSAVVAYTMSLEFYLSWRLNLEVSPQMSVTASLISFGFMLFLMVKRGTVGGNPYGADPLEKRA